MKTSKITISGINSYSNAKIEKELIENGIELDSNPLVNKLLLLKVLSVFLSLEEKQLLYGNNFDKEFIENNGSVDRFKNNIIKNTTRYPFSINTFSYPDPGKKTYIIDIAWINYI